MKIVAPILSLFLLLSLTANAQQSKVNNVTFQEFQRQFDRLVTQGFRPVKIWSKPLEVFDYQPGERPRLGYWAIFEKQPNTTPWVARHGLSQDAYQQEFSTWTQQGYMPTDINVACIDGNISYCVIYDKVPNQPAWVARHGLNYTDFTRTNDDLIRQGYTRTIMSQCQTPNGRVLAGLWVKR